MASELRTFVKNRVNCFQPTLEITVHQNLTIMKKFCRKMLFPSREILNSFRRRCYSFPTACWGINS